MNEIELRRELLADPRHVSAQLREAIESDPGLAALRDQLLAIDHEVRRTLTEPPVPEGLAERILLRARYGSRSRWSLALAATIAILAIGVSWVSHIQEGRLETQREQAMIEHVAQSTDELTDNPGIAPEALRTSVAALGVSVADPGYRIRHLANCVIAGIESRHFVVEGPHGLVSYVILPGARGGTGERMLEANGTRGLFAREGGVTVGVFTQTSLSREELEDLMRHVVAQGSIQPGAG